MTLAVLLDVEDAVEAAAFILHHLEALDGQQGTEEEVLRFEALDRVTAALCTALHTAGRIGPPDAPERAWR